MSTRLDLRPEFALTPEQEEAFKDYGPLDAIKTTLAARILSGDPSALLPTAEQIAFVARLAHEMGVSAPAVALSHSQA